jgi:hypothetical protein
VAVRRGFSFAQSHIRTPPLDIDGDQGGNLVLQGNRNVQADVVS